MDDNLNEMLNEDHRRSKYDHLAKLFEHIDKNKDGKIELDELKEAINEMNKDFKDLNSYSESVFERMKQSKTNKSEAGHITFKDFVAYMQNQDKNVQLIFSDIDIDKNGLIDANEIKKAFEKLNVFLNDNDILKLMSSIDSNKSLT